MNGNKRNLPEAEQRISAVRRRRIRRTVLILAIVIAFLICAYLAALYFIADSIASDGISASSIGIIGGADGPTAVIVSSGFSAATLIAPGVLIAGLILLIVTERRDRR
ncbi:MAG: hypothetical protein IJC48_00490 [Clostridia bacterium]|nr:hypothetical protein [Clostridia bacterium]